MRRVRGATTYVAHSLMFAERTQTYRREHAATGPSDGPYRQRRSDKSSDSSVVLPRREPGRQPPIGLTASFEAMAISTQNSEFKSAEPPKVIRTSLSIRRATS